MRSAVFWMFVAACGGGSEPATPAQDPTPDPASGWTEADLLTLSRLRATRELPPSPTNDWADNTAAADLGQALFYDAGLSPSGTVSCATCHDPALAFADGKPLGVGVGTAGRHTPTIPGSQQGPWFFWDGRADSLWAQAMGPVESPVEMGSDRMFAVRAALARHGERYEAVFGAPPSFDDRSRFPEHARPGGDPSERGVTEWASMTEADRGAVNVVFVNLVKAIAAYERTLLLEDAAFDRYIDAVVAGDDSGGGHLTDQQIHGLKLFLGDAKCVSCHHGPMLTDRTFHNLGLPEPHGFDMGRTQGAASVAASSFNCKSWASDALDCDELKYLNPMFEDFRGAFKTPTLRNVTRTAPYFHTGDFGTLQQVLTFYSVLPTEPLVGHRELTLRPLDLSYSDKEALIAFLGALESDVPADRVGPPR